MPANHPNRDPAAKAMTSVAKWLLAATLLAHSPLFAQSNFTGLGFLPGGGYSFATGLSANGSVVVGWSQNSNGVDEAFRWTRGVMSGLGFLPGGTFSYANAVSADGRAVVGYGESGTRFEAYRWTSANGMVGLGFLGAGSSEATGVSGNGAVVVGTSQMGAFSGNQAFRWTSSSGMTGLGFLPGGTVSSARAVSADGRVTVGAGNSSNGPSEAFSWTPATGMTGLGFLPGGTNSQANSVSADGRVIVGASGSGAGSQAFRWTAGSGMSGLGFLSGHSSSSASGVSGDGRVVVGASRANPAGNGQAFRWTQLTGMQSISDWLAGGGIALPAGWRLNEAVATNTDGSVVAGNATSPNSVAEAWLARVAAVGSGILLDIPGFNATLIEIGSQAAQAVAGVSNLVLFGAHHRTILDSGLARSAANGSCAWATADAATGRNRHNRMELVEAGVCKDVGAARVGVGVGAAQGRQQASFGGSIRNQGEYLVAEAARVFQQLQGSVLVYHGKFSTDLRRNYMNGAAVDSSSGAPDARSTAMRLRMDWGKAVRVSAIALSPYVAYTRINTKVDPYTETGGGFPASFAGASLRTHDVRAGAAATLPLAPATDLKLTLEGVRRMESNSSGVNGQVVGLFGFSLPSHEQRHTYARAILDVDHRLSKTSLITFSASSATKGADSRFGISVGYRAAF